MNYCLHLSKSFLLQEDLFINTVYIKSHRATQVIFIHFSIIKDILACFWKFIMSPTQSQWNTFSFSLPLLLSHRLSLSHHTLLSVTLTHTLCQRGSHHSDSASPAVVCGNSLLRQEVVCVCVYSCVCVYVCGTHQPVCCGGFTHTPSHSARVGVLSASSPNLTCMRRWHRSQPGRNCHHHGLNIELGGPINKVIMELLVT